MCNCRKGICKNCSCVKKTFFCTDKCKCTNMCISRKPTIFLSVSVNTEAKLHNLGEFLGKGTYGCVYTLQNENSLVIKISLKKKCILNEYRIYTKLFPQLPITLVDSTSINSQVKMYGMILPRFYRFNYEDMSFEDKKITLITLVNLLEHFHLNGYCHGDIKPDNIMFTNPNMHPSSITLIDLNLSTKINKSYSYVRGNLAYCSPRTQQLLDFQPIDDLISILFLSHKVLYGHSMKWGKAEDKINSKYCFLKNRFPNLDIQKSSHNDIKKLIQDMPIQDMRKNEI